MERALNQTPQDGSSEEEEPWGLTHIFLHRSCIGGGLWVGMGGFIKTCVRIVLVQRQHCTCTFLTADFRDITHSWFYCCWGLRKYAPNSVKNLLILKAIPVFLLCEVTKSEFKLIPFLLPSLLSLSKRLHQWTVTRQLCVCARVCVCVCVRLWNLTFVVLGSQLLTATF